MFEPIFKSKIIVLKKKKEIKLSEHVTLRVPFSEPSNNFEETFGGFGRDVEFDKDDNVMFT